jgi:hypothetical protein
MKASRSLVPLKRCGAAIRKGLFRQDRLSELLYSDSAALMVPDVTSTRTTT